MGLLALRWLTVLSASLFSGAALFVSIAEHPGRLTAGIDVALAEFGPSYKRAAPLQATLALGSLLGGCASALIGNDWRWAVGGITIGAVIPLTLAVIMPVNGKLLQPSSLSSEEAGRLLRRWGAFHLLRTALGVVGLLIFIVAAVH